MTNAQIIFNESVELMKNGIIRGTGEMINTTILDADGNEKTLSLEIPETIHTFQAWKNAGRKIKRGEKAVASFMIWKYTTRVTGTATNTETGETENIEDSRCFMKKAHFFTFAQTEPLAE